MTTSPTQAFFDELAERGHVPELAHERGQVRFDVVDSGCIRQWTVSFHNGDVEVSESAGAESDVDVVLRGDSGLFDRAVRGEANLMQAALRGELTYVGNIELLGPLGQLVPGPPGQTGPRRVTASGR